MNRLLLHTCCAPCLISALEDLKGYETECFYFNPNIMPNEEYFKRLKEVERVCEIYNVGLSVGEYSNNLFLEAIRGRELEAEGRER